MLKKWLATVGVSWLSWWMFQPVMTQLVVVAAEAEVMLRAMAAVPRAAVAARVTDRLAMSFLAGRAVVTVLADMTTPLGIAFAFVRA